MKKAVLLIFLFVVFSIAVFAQTLPRLAVVEFSNNNQSERLKEVSKAVRDLVESHMAGMRQYTIITRNEIDVLLQNQQIQVSNISSAENIQKLQILNINYIVTGSVNAMIDDYSIVIRLLDVSSGEYAHSVNELVGSSSRELHNSIQGLMNRFTAGMTSVGNRLVGGEGQRGYQVGDRGPGGGFIFSADSGAYMEISLSLGSYNWDRAVQAAKDHKGGGFNDWRLPSRDELNMIYQNLRRRNLAGLGNDSFWSSSQSNNDSAWFQNFSNCSQLVINKVNTYSVRAIRAF